MGVAASGALAALLALFVVVLVRTAWVSDDAYITFRTIDNFIGGYGLRWNVDERVQAYTHPLWMLLLSAGHAITREPYFTSIALGMACSMAAVALTFWRVAASPQQAILGGLALVGAKTLHRDAPNGREQDPGSRARCLLHEARAHHARTALLMGTIQDDCCDESWNARAVVRCAAVESCRVHNPPAARYHEVHDALPSSFPCATRDPTQRPGPGVGRRPNRLRRLQDRPERGAAGAAIRVGGNRIRENSTRRRIKHRRRLYVLWSQQQPEVSAHPRPGRSRRGGADLLLPGRTGRARSTTS